LDKATQELIRGYLDKANENLGVAERLLASEDHEVSISRSYYASFYAAHALLLTEDLHVKSHGGLVGVFGLHFVKTGKIDKKYGRYLSNLFEDRQKSDYSVYSGLERPDAENALSEAQEFVREVSRLLKPYV
jgi:uncharacterized protein (UPF0332 family)